MKQAVKMLEAAKAALKDVQKLFLSILEVVDDILVVMKLPEHK